MPTSAPLRTLSHMRFTSTRGLAPLCNLRAALFRGLAPDGGLYMPSTLVPLGERTMQELRGATLHTTAVTVARHLFGDGLENDDLERVVHESLGFAIPLVELDEKVFVLELFHGPTLAFKDVGARFMARLMAHYHRKSDRPLMVLAATSGDTGGAVAHAFAALPNTRVVILFPGDQVSPIQRRQFTTLGGNVCAVSVRGTFDDCQRLTKEALSDESFSEAFCLTSANSINVGRLLPQVLYHVHGWSQLPEGRGEIVVSVPSGNFGNLTAGLIAKRLGIPVRRFVAATNANDVVPQYLRTGAFTPRPSFRTISSAMDVGNPSNFDRILALYARREDELRRDVLGSWHSDDETRRAIVDVQQRFGYLLDPHSAVGYLGMADGLSRVQKGVGVFLATAHPAKFAETVASIIGRPIPLPEQLATLLARQEQVMEVGPTLTNLKAVLAQE